MENICGNIKGQMVRKPILDVLLKEGNINIIKETLKSHSISVKKPIKEYWNKEDLGNKEFKNIYSNCCKWHETKIIYHGSIISIKRKNELNFWKTLKETKSDYVIS